MKNYTVRFEKNFTTGILSGLCVSCQLGYSEYKTGAEEYVRWLQEDVIHTDCITNDRWFATNAEVVEEEVVI